MNGHSIRCLLCHRVALIRGLCNAHHHVARKKINAGVVTEKELMERGELLPSKAHLGRPKFNQPPQRAP